jgi:hypothetical protein
MGVLLLTVTSHFGNSSKTEKQISDFVFIKDVMMYPGGLGSDSAKIVKAIIIIIIIIIIMC